MPDIIRGNIPQYIPVKEPNIIKPSAYMNSTAPVHEKGHANGHRFNGSGTLGGASVGSAFGPYGAAFGALVGLGTDIWQAVYAKKRAKEANEQAEKAADVAAARNSAEARAARNYNSEQAQIRRMRMAGLSPGLAYGQMSPSTAQAPTIDKADVQKADTPKFDNESLLHAIQLLINQQNANTQAAAQQSAANLQDTQADLNRIEQGYKAQLGLANIASLLSSKELSDQQKLNLIAKQLPEIELLQSQANATDANARQANANANVVEQTGVDLAKSQTSANKASASKSNAESQSIQFEYGISKDEYDSVVYILKNYSGSLSDSETKLMLPFVFHMLRSVADRSGSTVQSLIEQIAALPGTFLGNLTNLFKLDDYSGSSIPNKPGFRPGKK